MLVFSLFDYSEQITVITSISHHLITRVYCYLLYAIALFALLTPYFQLSFITIPKKISLSSPTVCAQIAWRALLISVCFYFLFPVQNFRQTVNDTNKIGKYAVGARKPFLPENISGKLVYHSTKGGIYIGKLGEFKSLKIVEQGMYPRWSPDGESIAYIDKNKIMLIHEKSREAKVLANAGRARALCFSPDGKSVLFTDGKMLRSVEIESHIVKTILDGHELLEIDAAGAPTRIAATVRTSYGYKVQVFDLGSGEKRAVKNGCSASLSPDGTLITVNGKKHRILYLYHWASLKLAGKINAPAKEKFDNQFWSNSPHWLISVTEGEKRDAFIHHVSENRHYRVTWTGDCDRADLFINGTEHSL